MLLLSMMVFLLGAAVGYLEKYLYFPLGIILYILVLMFIVPSGLAYSFIYLMGWIGSRFIKL